jgi:hypothetical protein
MKRWVGGLEEVFTRPLAWSCKKGIIATASWVGWRFIKLD